MSKQMSFGDLFAGIGGISLGFERTNLKCKWQVENNEFCNNVRRKHWPDIAHFEDIKDFPPASFESLKVDLITAGFPCKDCSNAKTAIEAPRGLKGEQSGLWFEAYRVIRRMEPRWVVIENVGSLSTRGLETVLWQIAECGYSGCWQTLSAAALGAPHLRKRLFIVAVQDAHGEGLEGHVRKILAQPKNWRQDAYAARSDWGDSAPRLCGGAYGVPPRMVQARPRLTALGNAVVPKMAHFIASRIIRADRQLFGETCNGSAKT